jgi:hypothetical protein
MEISKVVEQASLMNTVRAARPRNEMRTVLNNAVVQQGRQITATDIADMPHVHIPSFATTSEGTEFV